MKLLLLLWKNNNISGGLTITENEKERGTFILFYDGLDKSLATFVSDNGVFYKERK